MNIATALLRDIEAYLERTGVAETTFGRRVVNDGKFVGRLRDGKGITIATVERVQAFLSANQPVTPPRRRKAA